MYGNCEIMAIVNLTPDSFCEKSRVRPEEAMSRIGSLLDGGADIIDLGAVSTRPGAGEISTEEEWGRLRPVLQELSGRGIRFSIDTTRSEVVRRAFDTAGAFIVNDISAGEDDSEMLSVVGSLGLEYIAMHKRGTPATMDTLCDYPEGIIPALMQYFREFDTKAAEAGIRNWILDPGLGFAKTPQQCIDILNGLQELKTLGHRILIGAADKRFTLKLAEDRKTGTRKANELAIKNGADILRVHDLDI